MLNKEHDVRRPCQSCAEINQEVVTRTDGSCVDFNKLRPGRIPGKSRSVNEKDQL